MLKAHVLSRRNFLLFTEYIIFFVSIVFSLRAVSSIFIGLIVLTGFIRRKRSKNYFLNDKWSLFFLFGCSLLFVIQCISLLYTDHIANAIKILQRDSGLFFTPFALVKSRGFLTEERYRKLMFYFAVILSLASLYCLAFAAIKYSTGGSISVFFYHDLVKSLSQHAIQFSILVFGALLFLFEHSKEPTVTSFNFLRRPMIVFLSFFLILLSSKLIISFYVLYLLYSFFNKEINKSRSKIFAVCFIALITVTLLTHNPVSTRFRAVLAGNVMLFEQKEFNPGVYFNGVQFRLLQWRFTYEILNEQHAWITGLTPGDAQFFLDKKYVTTKMYTGISGTDNHGFLGYHTHNQFLQALLENGLPALAVFLFICYVLFKMVIASQRKELKWLLALLIAYCFTDAPFQTQYGLIIFTFLPVLFHCGQKSIKSRAIRTDNNAIPESNYALTDAGLYRQPN